MHPQSAYANSENLPELVGIALVEVLRVNVGPIRLLISSSGAGLHSERIGSATVRQ